MKITEVSIQVVDVGQGFRWAGRRPMEVRGVFVALATDAGIVLNNEMDDCAAAPGVPNAFGLVGNEANAIEPGKRPLSSMTPTVVLDADGRVVMAIGASGGSFIISSVLQNTESPAAARAMTDKNQY